VEKSLKASDGIPGEMSFPRLIVPIWIHVFWDAPMLLRFPLEIAPLDVAR
jgi:hypothetical protein